MPRFFSLDGMPGPPAPETIEDFLDRHTDNRGWLDAAIRKTATDHHLVLPQRLADAAGCLMRTLSAIDADRFALSAMMRLPNRYPWTFRRNGTSLTDILRREARIVRFAWERLCREARKEPLMVILNETTPTDYLTAMPPRGAAFFSSRPSYRRKPILIWTGLKIASSEHREPLAGSPEGDGLTAGVSVAEGLRRRPVLVDFSRRRFPRSFLRAARFAREQGWGLDPWGKVRDDTARHLPESKSPRGFAPQPGHPVLALFDPWPLSDPNVIAPDVRTVFLDPSFQKPWQDDRIGARTELEADELGIYRPVARPWIIPTPVGWMRVDDLFRRHLARHLAEMRS